MRIDVAIPLQYTPFLPAIAPLVAPRMAQASASSPWSQGKLQEPRDTPGLQEFPHLHACECLHARYAATLLHPSIVSRLLACVDTLCVETPCLWMRLGACVWMDTPGLWGLCVGTPGLWMRLGAWGSQHTARACIFLLSISRHNHTFQKNTWKGAGSD